MPKAKDEARAPSRPAPRQREPEPETADDDGWNGPVPSFLGKGFGS